MKSWPGLLCLTLASCVGAARALDSAGQHGTQLGFGAAAGGAMFLLVPGGGILLAAAAGVAGALAAVLSTPPAVVTLAGGPGHSCASPFVWILVGAGLALAARSWAHWGPAAVRLLAPAVKKSVRAALGGLDKKK